MVRSGDERAVQGRVRTGVPDLCLHGLAVDGQRTCRKLDADGRLGLEVEFVAREPREHCSFTRPTEKAQGSKIRERSTAR